MSMQESIIMTQVESVALVTNRQQLMGKILSMDIILLQLLWIKKLNKDADSKYNETASYYRFKNANKD